MWTAEVQLEAHRSGALLIYSNTALIIAGPGKVGGGSAGVSGKHEHQPPALNK
jgi:hypothetical protein